MRVQLGKWVVLGETSYFSSQIQCTAGVFRTKAKNVTSRISKASSIDRGLRLITSGKAVAFKVDGMTPAQLHEALDRVNPTVGLAILTSGLGARSCLPPDLKDAFSTALGDVGVILMYDPQNNAVVLFDGAQKRVFYARGEV